MNGKALQKEAVKLADSGPVDHVVLTAAVTRLGMAKLTVLRLAELGAIECADIDGVRRFTVPHDGSRQRILDDYVVRNPAFRGDDDLDRYRTIFKALDKVQHRIETMEAGREFLNSEGIAVSGYELAGAIGGRDQIVRFLKEDRQRRKGFQTVGEITGGAGVAATETMDQVIRRMALGNHVAKGTAADPRLKNAFEPLTAEQCRGLLALTNESLFRVVALYLMIRLADDIAPQTVTRIIGFAHRMNAMLSGVHISSPAQMTKRLNEYVVEKSVLPDDSDHTRAGIVYMLYSIWEVVNDWLDLIQHKGSRAFFETMSFSLPRRGSRIIRALSDMERERKHATRTTRKLRSDRLVAGFDITRHLVEVRSNQVRRMHEAYRTACSVLDAMDDNELAAALPYEFWYEEHVPATSEKLAADQVVILRITTRAQLVRDLLAQPGPVDHELRKSDVGGIRYSPEDEREYLLELVDTRAIRPDGPVNKIWLEEIARSCVYFNPAILAPGHASSRRDMLRQLELSAAAAEHGLNLVGFGPRLVHTLLYRAFAELRRLFIPIENAFITTAFGRIPIRVSTINGARPSEIMQMVHDPDSWGTIVSPETRLEIDFFKAVPKGKRKKHVFFIDKETMSAVADLVDHISERFYSNGDLTEIPPCGWLAGKQTESGTLPADRYIFRFNGNMLDHPHFVTCQRILLQGETAYLPHDERHAFATVARQEGMDVDVLQTLMNHELKSDTRYYSTPTRTEVEETIGSFIVKRHDAAVLLETAEQTLDEEQTKDLAKIGGLQKMPGGRCYQAAPCHHNMTACVGCARNGSDPLFREEILRVERRAKEALREAEEAGFMQFAAQERQRLEDAQAMLREMDLVELARADAKTIPTIQLGLRPHTEKELADG